MNVGVPFLCFCFLVTLRLVNLFGILIKWILGHDIEIAPKDETKLVAINVQEYNECIRLVLQTQRGLVVKDLICKSKNNLTNFDTKSHKQLFHINSTQKSDKSTSQERYYKFENAPSTFNFTRDLSMTHKYVPMFEDGDVSAKWVESILFEFEKNDDSTLNKQHNQWREDVKRYINGWQFEITYEDKLGYKQKKNIDLAKTD
jgi:hypothetical protein